MMDYVELGSAPVDENCVQVNSRGDYHQAMKDECRRYLALLEKKFPNPPPSTYFKVKSFPHDFGTYYEVVVYYDVDSEESCDFAMDIENNLPDRW